MPMNRRFVLATALGALLWPIVAPGRALALGVDRPSGSDLARALVATLRRPDSAAAVGRAYLARFPAEALSVRLVEGIREGLARDGFDPVVPTGRPAELRSRLGKRVRRDFAEGRVVAVDGWVLAATEARLFALAALRRGG